MALIEFDGELDPPAAPAAPRLKEFNGELDQPAAGPRLKEFTGELDAAPSGGFLRSFVDIAKDVGGAITGQTGRRQRLEQQAGGVSVMEPRPSDFELQERIAQRPAQPSSPSMTQGPANPQTFSTNLPLNMDSRPGEVVRSAADIASRVPEQALNSAGQGLVGAKRWVNDATNKLQGITADPYMDSVFNKQTADLKGRETVMHAPLTPAQSFTTQAAGEGLKQAATALTMAPLAAASGAGKASELVRLGAGMAVPAATQKYEDLSAAGLKGAPLALFSALSGAIEGGTEAIPFTFMKYAKLPGFREAIGAYKAGDPSALASFAKYYAGSMATETAQEIPSTVLGHQLDFVTGDPTATAKRLGPDLADTVAELPIQVAVQAGVMHGAKRLHANTLGRQSPQDRVAEELAGAVDATQFGRPSPAQIAEASVFRAPSPAGTMEADKPFAKRVVDQRPAPEALPEQHDLYFNMGNATVMPIDSLISTKTEAENQQGGDNGPKRMAAAAAGELGKRDPITVMPSETPGKFEVVDGNGTLTSVKKYGWQSMPVTVVPREQGLAMIEADHAKESAKVAANVKSTGPTGTTQPFGADHGKGTQEGWRQEVLTPDGTSVPSGMPIQTMQQADGLPLEALQRGKADAQGNLSSDERTGKREIPGVEQYVQNNPESGINFSRGMVAGFPSFIKSGADIEAEIQRHMDDFKQANLDDAVWYSTAGKIIAKYGHDNHLDMDTIARLTAKFAQSMGIQGNTTAVMQALEQLRKGQPVKSGKYPNQFAIEIEKLLSAPEVTPGVPGINRKLNSFYWNLWDEVQKSLGKPEQHPEHITVDQHAGTYALKKKVNGVSSQEYAYADMVMREATKRLNAEGWGEKTLGRPLQYKEMQAGLWGLHKARGAGNEKLNNQNLTGGEAAWNYPEYMARGTDVVQAETVPSKDVSQIYSKPNAGEFNRKALEIVRPGGVDKLAEKIGIRAYYQSESTGGYDGTISPNMVTGILTGKTSKKSGQPDLFHRFSHETADTYAWAWQYIYRQDAVPWYRADPSIRVEDLDKMALKRQKALAKSKVREDGSRRVAQFDIPNYALGLDIAFDHDLTPEQEAQFFAALREHVSPYIGFTRSSPNTITVINYRGSSVDASGPYSVVDRNADTGAPFLMPDIEFHNRIDDVVHTTKEVSHVVRFAAETRYDAHDWKSDPEGRAIEDKISAAGRSDLLPWLRDRRAEADALADQHETQGKGLPLQALKQGQPLKTLAVTDVIPEDVLSHVRNLLGERPPIKKTALPEAVMVKATLMLKPLVEAANRNKPAYDKALAEIAREIGGVPLTVPVKDAERSAVKLVEEYNYATENMMDLLRGTILVSSEAEARAAIEAISKRFKLARAPKDRFAKPTAAGYRDILVNPVMPDGTATEILIMTPEMFAAKDLGHELYNHTRLPETPAVWSVKANFASKLVYGLAADAATSLSNSGFDTGMPKWKADAAGKVRGFGSNAMADKPSGANATGTSSKSTKVQPFATNSSGVMGASSNRNILAQGGTGVVDGAQQQAGASFVYGPLAINDAGAGLVTQYRPKLDERTMARRGLEPLESKQVTVVDEALGDIIAAGLPRSWAEKTTFYGLKPIGLGLANYNPEDAAIGILTPELDRAAKGEAESKLFIRGWLAHELHHLVDNYRNSPSEMFYLSAESPRMDMRVLPNGKFVGGGDLAMEVMNVWNGITEASDELVQFLGYPMLQAQAMASNLAGADGAMAFAKVELFAQLGAMYTTNPTLMERELPQWFAFFEEWSNARGNGTVERSRVALRGLFQKSVPKRADQGRGRGAGLPAGAVGQDQQRPVLTARRPGMGANAPGAGNGGGSPVLPAAPQAAQGQNALGAYKDIARANIPGNNHIPTHVNYSTFNSANELKKVYAGLSEKFEKDIQEQRRGTISHKESYRDARRLIEDEAGISARKVDSLLSRKPGTPAGAAEILARMAILESETAKVEAMAKKIDQQGTLQTSGQEWLDFAAQLDRAAMAHQTFLGARAEIGRALNAIKGFSGMPYDGKQVQSVLDTYQGPEGLGKVATAIVQSGQQGAAPGRSNAIGRLAKAASKATITDAVIELWKANLLSGPTTHLANIVSNALFTIMRLPEQAVAGTVGALHGGKSAHLGQTLALAFGMSHGVVQGFRAAGKIMADEDAAFGATPTEEHQHAIAGDTFGASGRLGKTIDYLGKAVRLPFRMLSAEDAVFKMVNMYGSLYSEAMRTALDEGGRYWDKGFSHRVAELIKEGEQVMLDPAGAMGPTAVSEAGKAVGHEAISDGLTYTFQNKLGKIGQSVETLRNNVKATHFIIPFVRTPLNIFRQGLERTPFAPMSKQWRDEVSAGGHARDMALGKAMLGTALMAAVWSAVEAGMITGGGDPEDFRRKRRMEAGIIPYGIKINGKWYEYRRLEPLGTIIGAAADAAETRRYAQEDNAEHVMAMAAAAFSQAVTSKTYMKGLSDLVNVMAQPERYGERWYQSMAGSLVPAAIGQHAARNDLENGRPVVRDVRSMGEGVSGLEDLKQTTANAIKNRLPKTPLNPEFNRESLPKRIDTWGDTQTSAPGTFSGSPIRTSEPTADPVRQEAQRLGIKMTDAGTKVMGVKMTAPQLEEFSRASGLLAHNVLAGIVTLESWQDIPDFAKVKVFEEAIKAGREYGRGIITPEVIDMAIEKTLKGLADVESD